MSYQNIKSAGTGKFKLYSGSQDYIKSVVFFSCLVATLLVSLFYAYTSSGPIILGSELNANGSIEYMCLGNSCHDLNGFTWNDKK